MVSVKVVSSCSLTDAVRKSSLLFFLVCATRVDVANLSELIVARNARSLLLVQETHLSAVFKARLNQLSGSSLLGLMYRHI